jgi:hypothetical protein
MEPNLVVPLTIKFEKLNLNSNENSLEAKSTVAWRFSSSSWSSYSYDDKGETRRRSKRILKVSEKMPSQYGCMADNKHKLRGKIYRKPVRMTKTLRPRNFVTQNS